MRQLLAIAAVAALAASVAGAGAASVGRLAGDPLQAQEWWLADVGADRATPPGPGVPLTIVDAGIDTGSPELAGRPNTVLLNPQTVFGETDFHATAIASLAAAPENGTGIVGVYPQALLQSWDAVPGTSLNAVSAALGIETAARRCPGVLNLSFGGVDPNLFVQQAILDAVHNGCLVVAAAGNGRMDGNPRSYPAALPHVLAVAATTSTDAVAPFSTAGTYVDLAAPGDGLLAAVTPDVDPSGYATVSGTSFAAPLVSAAAAWIWTARPTLDAGQVFELLLSTARDVGAPGWDPDTGFGILDVAAALAAPAPARDPWEPNDDVNQVVPGAIFAGGQPALTRPAKISNHVIGTLDAADDPRDVYRIWVPPNRVVRVRVTAGADAAAARIWGPQTVSVLERSAERRRDLLGTSASAGARGFAAYVEVSLTGRSPRTTYTLAVTVSKR